MIIYPVRLNTTVGKTNTDNKSESGQPGSSITDSSENITTLETKNNSQKLLARLFSTKKTTAVKGKPSKTVTKKKPQSCWNAFKNGKVNWICVKRAALMGFGMLAIGVIVAGIVAAIVAASIAAFGAATGLALATLIITTIIAVQSKTIFSKA